MVYRLSLGVSLDVYRARIGLHHLRVSGSSLCIGTYYYVAKWHLGVVLIPASLLVSDVLMLTVVFIYLLLFLSGDIELNPGPNETHPRYFTFCHANMRSIKKMFR